MTLDEILEGMEISQTVDIADELLLIDPNTRQIDLPGNELVLGVESDTQSDRKYFLCPRIVGNDLDLATCFLRINYRNANGEIDAYLVEDISVSDDDILFSWVLSKKVTMYRGQVKFLVCAARPMSEAGPAVEWHTTLATGLALEGLEPDSSTLEEDTADVIAQLIGMVEGQTDLVEAEGATQIAAVQSAAEAAEAAVLAEVEAKGVNTLASIPSDYTAVSDAVDALVRSTAPGIVCEVDGSSVSVGDASDQAMRGLRIFGRSIQDGVPSPEAPVEIVSIEAPVVTVTGKNLVPPGDASFTDGGIVSTPTDDGTIVLTGTAERELSRIISQNFLLHPGKYTLSVTGLHVVDGNKDRLYLSAEDNSGTIVNYIMTDKPVTFEVTQSVSARASVVLASGSTYDNEAIFAQLEAGDAATPYEPYTASQTVSTTNVLRGIPVSSGGNYTDSAGQQWLCDEVDLERGVYVQRLSHHTLSSGLQFSSWTDGEKEIGIIVRGLTWDLTIRDDPTAMCSHFIPDVNGSITTGQVGIRLRNDYPYLYFLHTVGVATTADEWKAYFDAQITNGTPVELVVKAAEVVETPLSETEIAAYRALHTNKPYTTVLNSAGAHMAAAYTADTKLYIDNKIAALVSGT